MESRRSSRFSSQVIRFNPEGSTGVGSEMLSSDLAFMSANVTVHTQMETFKEQLENWAMTRDEFIFL